MLLLSRKPPAPTEAKKHPVCAAGDARESRASVYACSQYMRAVSISRHTTADTWKIGQRAHVRKDRVPVHPVLDCRHALEAGRHREGGVADTHTHTHTGEGERSGRHTHTHTHREWQKHAHTHTDRRSQRRKGAFYGKPRSEHLLRLQSRVCYTSSDPPDTSVRGTPVVSLPFRKSAGVRAGAGQMISRPHTGPEENTRLDQRRRRRQDHTRGEYKKMTPPEQNTKRTPRLSHNACSLASCW